MTFLSQMITAEIENLSRKLISCDPDFIDIDLDRTDPQLCSLYAADIYGNLRVAEVCAVESILLFL